MPLTLPLLSGGRYEFSRDPESWLDIDRDTGDISARRAFNMRSPHVKNNIYIAVVKVTGQFTSSMRQPGELDIHFTPHGRFLLRNKYLWLT